MRVICQLAPRIGEGTGVGAVAHGLARAFVAKGICVEEFTLTDTPYRSIPTRSAIARHVEHLLEVVYFSTRGSARARARLRREPDTWSICHNDLLAGDVYVNHGLLRVAMESRGHAHLRMLRNPLHLFTNARDWWRFNHSQAHRAVVHLNSQEETAFRRLYPRSRLRTAVIGNGVDLEKYRPPSAPDRAAARTALGLPTGTFVVTFVGHEFARKGLDLLIEALADLPDHVHLVVAGGSAADRRTRRARAQSLGVADRLHLQGIVPDSLALLQGSDLLALPSAYEAFSLIVLEALACGVPVLSTPVGAAPDLIRSGANGVLVDRTASSVAAGIRAMLDLDLETARRAARDSAEPNGWDAVAARYLDLLAEIHADGSSPQHCTTDSAPHRL